MRYAGSEPDLSACAETIEMADKLGNPKSANMVMLGAFIKKSNLVSINSLIDEIKNTLKNKDKLIAINEKALMAGYNLF